MTKIAVIIPDRGDRPQFTERCLSMLARQTLQPSQIILVNEPPKNQLPDITYRYRKGYSQVNKDIDIIAFIENDDWYSAQYLQQSVDIWMKSGKPDLIGRTHTVYYNINERAYFTMNHSNRSSAMNTLIKPRLDIKWCKDTEVYTDLHLWYNVPNIHKIIVEQPLNCIGIKHGVGLCGGKNHTDYLHRYVNKDDNMFWLMSIVDEESFNFYINFAK